MKYKLTITDRAEQLLDNILYHIVNKLKNPQAAENLMKEVERVYNNLEYSPEMYSYSEDGSLKSRGYRKVAVPHYNYVIIFRFDEDRKTVYIVGFFHDLELYINKL